MTVYTLKGTTRRATAGLATGKGEAYKSSSITKTVELAAAASASTFELGYIPSNARLLGASRIYWDDLATSGSPTLDIGLFPVDGNITGDDDAINDGMDLATINSTVGLHVIKDIANFGVPAWSLVNGQTTDPGGVLLVKATTKDASTTATGTITCELHYVID